jgi:hypothetical protein
MRFLIFNFPGPAILKRPSPETFMYVHINIYTYVYSNICSPVDANIYTYVYTYIYIYICMYIHVLSHFSHVQFFATLWTVAHQTPPSMKFSSQEYCSGLPFPSPGDFPNPGTEPGSPTLRADVLSSEPPAPQ